MVTLSELVAVEVMGWEKVESFPRMDRSDGRTLFFDGREYKVEDDCGQVSRPFRPDTNIADASRVVDAVAAKYPGGAWHKWRRCDGVWRCEFLDGPGHNAMAREETEPMAIVVCALRAVGVSDDRIEKARSKQ